MAPPSATATVGFVSKSSALFVFNDQNSNNEINLARLGIRVPTAINLTLGTWNPGRSEKIAIYNFHPNVPTFTEAEQHLERREGRARQAVRGVNGNFLVYNSAWLAGQIVIVVVERNY